MKILKIIQMTEKQYRAIIDKACDKKWNVFNLNKDDYWDYPLNELDYLLENTEECRETVLACFYDNECGQPRLFELPSYYEKIIKVLNDEREVK